MKTLPPPATPTCVSAVAGNGQVAVGWDIVAGATTYNLYRATKRGGDYALLAEGVSGVTLSYMDKAVANGTIYYYVVAANSNGNGTSKKSAAVNAMPTRNLK